LFLHVVLLPNGFFPLLTPFLNVLAPPLVHSWRQIHGAPYSTPSTLVFSLQPRLYVPTKLPLRESHESPQPAFSSCFFVGYVSVFLSPPLSVPPITQTLFPFEAPLSSSLQSRRGVTEVPVAAFFPPWFRPMWARGRPTLSFRALCFPLFDFGSHNPFEPSCPFFPS